MAASDLTFVLLGTPLDQFEAGDHRRQQVVEIVRHPAGKLADRLHFLRLTKLRLQCFPLSDVPGGGHDEPLVALLFFRYGYEHHVNRAGAARHGAAGHITLPLAGAQALAEVSNWHLRRLHAQHLLYRSPDHLLPRQPVRFLAGMVEVDVAERTLRSAAEQTEPVGREVEERL